MNQTELQKTEKQYNDIIKNIKLKFGNQKQIRVIELINKIEKLRDTNKNRTFYQNQVINLLKQ